MPDEAYNSINNSDLRGFKKAYSDIAKYGQYGQIQIPSTTKTIGYEAFYEKLDKDGLIKEVINLFKFEICRKTEPNESKIKRALL